MSRLRTPSYPTMITLLGVLACVAPATIDAYLPAFGAIEREFNATPRTVQQTLGVYMFAYACMMLFHGSLSDCFGRRRVICLSLGIYTAGSIGAVFASDMEWLLIARIVQGLSAGAGVVVTQAIIRDCYEGTAARRAMSYVVLAANVSPALAPIIGGYLSQHHGWRSVFLAMAALSMLALLLCMTRLPETLASKDRKPFSWSALLKNYGRVAGDLEFIGLSVSFSFLIGGQALIIGSAPDLIVRVIGLQETDFAYLFVPIVIGAMAGALFSARMAGRLSGTKIILIAYLLMGGSSFFLVSHLLLTASATVFWMFLPLAVFICGLALAAPGMTLEILSRMPHLSGMAASVLGFLQILFFSLVSGWFVPLVYGQPAGLAAAMLGCVCLSAIGWIWMTSRRSVLA